MRGAVTDMGGITALKKTLDYAAMYQIKSGMYGPTDTSPVGMAAAMHLRLAIHNFRYSGVQAPRREELLHPGDKPGLGVELNLDEAGRYSYEQAYVPYSRLADAAVHDW